MISPSLSADVRPVPSSGRLHRVGLFLLAGFFLLVVGGTAPIALAEETAVETGSAAKPTGAFLPVKAGADDSKVYPLTRDATLDPVIDGDTVRLTGLESTVRLLGVDAEEVYHNDRDEHEAQKDFAKYAAAKRGDQPRPVKYGTPAGVAAANFCREFFKGVNEVLLLRDDPQQELDYFGRHLGYILVDRDGDGLFEQNFSLELVRAGHSPYYVKYGRLLRYDAAFVAAQEEARNGKRGIWADAADAPEHYDDYPQRLSWWESRAAAIDHFRKEHGADPSYVRLGIASEFERMASMVGKRVTIFGTVGLPYRPLKVPKVRAFASHRNKADVAVLCSDDDVWTPLGKSVTDLDGELVYLSGVVRAGDREGTLALELDSASRIWCEPSKPAAEPAAPGDEVPGADVDAPAPK